MSQLKILFIGDPHLKITHFELSKKFLEWINTTIEKYRPDLVINLGDTFDTHAVVRSEIMTEFLNHVEYVTNICPYIYLLGNHDQYRPNDSKYHALKHLKNRLNKFTVVDEITNLHGMTFVPYIHKPEDFPKSTLPICIAHQTFKGADFGDITTKDGVDASSIEGAEIIISGHIHKKQTLNSGNVSVIYPGSPFSSSASDVDQIKGVTIFDTATYNETFIPCPLPMWKSLSFDIDEEYSAQDILKDLKNSLNMLDNWIISISGPKAEILSLLNSKEYKDTIKNVNLKLKTSFIDKEKKYFKIKSNSIESIITDFIDNVYKGSIDKDILKTESLKLINSYKNSSDIIS
jgi:DNA repair exonuclease SbcCD nuclease subunit